MLGPFILLGLTVAACGGSSSGSVGLKTGKVSGLGTVVVDSTGRTLYAFGPDQARRVTCTGQCAAVWMPLRIASGQRPSVSGAVRASLVGSAPNPSGGSVVTYNGWPLYRYVADTGAGTAQGQAMRSAGGVWHAVAPSGRVIMKTGGAGSHTGSGKY